MTAASTLPAPADWRNSSRAAARSRAPPSPRSLAAAASNRASASAIEPGHPLRAHPKPVKRQAGEVAARAPEPTAPPPPLGRGRRLNIERLDPADPADEVDILHQRQRPVAAHIVVAAPGNEQALVAIRKSEQPHPERHARLDQPRLPFAGVEPEPEAGDLAGPARHVPVRRL